jgi:hypothetical protein
MHKASTKNAKKKNVRHAFHFFLPLGHPFLSSFNLPKLRSRT